MPRAASDLLPLTTSLPNLLGYRFADASDIESAYQETIYDNVYKDYLNNYGILAPQQVPTVSTVTTAIQGGSATTGGTIPASTTYWYAVTFVTMWGETPIGTVTNYTSGGTTSTNTRTMVLNSSVNTVAPTALYARVYRSTVGSTGPFYLLGTAITSGTSISDTGQDLTANAQPPATTGAASERAGYYRSWQFATADTITNLGTYVSGPTGTRVRMVVRLQSSGAIVAQSSFISLPASYGPAYVEGTISYQVTPATSYLIGVESESNQQLRPYSNYHPAEITNGYASEGAGYYTDSATNSSSVSLTQNTTPVGMTVPFQLPLRVVRRVPLTVSTLVSSQGKVESGLSGRTVVTLKASAQASGVSAVTADSNVSYSAVAPGFLLEVSADGGTTWTTLTAKVKSYLANKAYTLKFRITNSTDFYDSLSGSGAGFTDRSDSDHVWVSLGTAALSSAVKTTYTTAQGASNQGVYMNASGLMAAIYSDAVDVDFDGKSATTSSTSTYLVWRWRDAQNHYRLRLLDTSVQFSKLVGNSATAFFTLSTNATTVNAGPYVTTVGLTPSNTPVPWSSGAGIPRMRIVMIGANCYVFSKGVLVAFFSDAAFSAGRYPIGMYDTSSSGSADFILGDMRIAQPYPSSSLDWLAAYLEA